MIEQPRRDLSSLGWCCRCRANRMINGTVKVSSTGVRRVQGRCSSCGMRGQNGLLDLAASR